MHKIFNVQWLQKWKVDSKKDLLFMLCYIKIIMSSLVMVADNMANGIKDWVGGAWVNSSIIQPSQ